VGHLTRDTILHLLKGDTMTARRQATQSAHQAWVGVVSLERTRDVYLNTADAAALGRMLVQSFEMADDLLEQYDDVGIEEATLSERFTVNDVQELEALLERLGVDPATLAFKATTGYPL
jgi:hypothetical protein